MAALNAVIDTATGAVKRSGYCDFTADGSFDAATEEQVAVKEGAQDFAEYTKVVDGAFVEMGPAEKATVDAAKPVPPSIEVTGSRGDGTALESLLRALAAKSIIVDSTVK